MQHEIDTRSIGATGEFMTQAVNACVHCGFCLPACPTYRVLEEEMDSPRGRIILMKEVLEGGVASRTRRSSSIDVSAVSRVKPLAPRGLGTASW